ncbi:MAG: NAD-dependent dihydropyrimidine dehydrogenase subunit PreA [Phycisphaerae bacterium]|nr:NAD-dependent dihydropyrimidine dehydrogenase subunit PreA [Phycisphaerae bacterium]
MADLSVQVNGLRLPNPFMIGSGPPSTNAGVIAKAFDEGWGGVVTKTCCLRADRIINVSPRYARLRSADSADVYGWENIELISDRPFDTWLDEFRQLKEQYPDRALVASIMEECNRDAWVEIVERTQATGVDALELNLSCPHGLPERKMGSAMGQDPEIVQQVCGWVMEAARVPVWAKLTPNVTFIDEPGRAALQAGVYGLSAINTLLCVAGVNLETLRPEPTVAGYSMAGGYSSKAIRPIAMRMVMELARLRDQSFPAASISGIGGIETGDDAVQFILLGADTVQVCTGVMKFGFGMIRPMIEAMSRFMDHHGFASVSQFKGHSLQYFTTHAELVRRQAATKLDCAGKDASAGGNMGTSGNVGGIPDSDWRADQVIEQSERLSQ